MSEDLVLVDRSRRHVSVITLNRPGKRNALSIPLLHAFCGALDEIHGDPDQRVIILTGAGPSFCAGLDLTEALDPDKSRESGDLVRQGLRRLMESPLVTIAAARGAAIAGGAGYMLACDLAVVSEDFRTGFTEVRLGLVAGLVMTFLRRKVGEVRAREMLLLGDLIGAEEALSWGMVNRVVPPAALMDTAHELAGQALKGAKGAQALTKTLFDSLYHIPVAEHLDLAEKLHREMRTTDEAQEGLAAFREKRVPNWDPEYESGTPDTV